MNFIYLAINHNESVLKSRIKNYKFKHGLPFEFEIIDISDLYRKSKNIVTEPHRASFYHIIWIKQGKPTHFVDFIPMKIESNSLLFVAKDCVNVFDTKSEYEGKMIIFTDDFFCYNPNDLNFLQSTILYNDLFDIAQIQLDIDDQLFPDLFRSLELEYNKDSDSSQYLILRNLLHNFMLLAERERRKQGFKEIAHDADLDYLLQFKDRIKESYKTLRTVSKYAADLGVSEKRLNKATTKILDKSPKQLIDDRIILEAKRLLAHTSLSIKEIAFELGFEEPTNFNKYFRKHNHVTPVEFRNRYT